VAAAALVVVSTVWSDPRRALFGALLMGIGVPVYFAYRRRRLSA
jgi:hypothetical protein